MLYALVIKTKAFASFLFEPLALLSAGLGSLLLGCFEKYLFSDWELLRWMVVLMSLESASSLYRGFRKKTLSGASFDRMIHKSLIYGFMLALYHVLKNYIIGSELDLPSRYLVMAIALRESFSVLEHLAMVTSLIPKWLMDKMRLLSEQGMEETQEKQERSVGSFVINKQENNTHNENIRERHRAYTRV